MRQRVLYHALARADLYDVWSWYEIREAGLGDRLVTAIDAVLDQIAEWPQSGSSAIEIAGEVIERRVVTAGFPYVVRYRVVDDTILVTAIYHQRRRPDFASERLPGP